LIFIVKNSNITIAKRTAADIKNAEHLKYQYNLYNIPI